MSDSLFGSITLPPELDQLVGVHRLQIDGGRGVASLLDGWRAFLRHQLGTGPMAILSTGAEHLEHFADDSSDFVDELTSSLWMEVVALGVAMQSLRSVAHDVDDRVESTLPAWLTKLETRAAVRASVRDDSPSGGPTPWVVEIDFGAVAASSVNVWINSDGSLYQLYLSDESIDELEAFLGEINHLDPNRPFERVPPTRAFDAISGAANHPATAAQEVAMFRWLLRTPFTSVPA